MFYELQKVFQRLLIFKHITFLDLFNDKILILAKSFKEYGYQKYKLTT